MSEHSPKQHIYEKLRNRELSDKRKREIGSIAVETTVVSSEKLAKAKRLQKLGRHIAAASDLRSHRKEVHHKKLEGLKGALDSRRNAEATARQAVKYAKKGERALSSSERKANIKNQFEQERARVLDEQGKSEDSFRGISGRIERHGIKKEAKERAKAAIKAKEQAAAEQIELRKQELKLAKARKSQTRSSLLKTAMRVGHNKSNLISAYKDAAKTQEARLDDLRARRNFNEYMGSGRFQADRIDEANEALEIGKYTPEAVVETEQDAAHELSELTVDTEVTIPRQAEIGWDNIGDFVPGGTAAYAEAKNVMNRSRRVARKQPPVLPIPEAPVEVDDEMPKAA